MSNHPTATKHSSAIKPLPTRPLGRTGIQLSVLGLGTVKFGRDQQVKYPQPFQIPSDTAVRELLSLAKELGINFIDTAPAYGQSEERLGALLKNNRQDWLIASKVGEEFIDGQSRYDFTPEHVQFSVERSLKRLKTDYLDLMLIHSNGEDLDILKRFGTLDKLQQLKDQGLIRAIGMSTKTVAGGKLAAEKSDAVMVTYNLKETAEAEVITHAQANHCAVIIKKALASGHLTHTPTQPSHSTQNPTQTAAQQSAQHLAQKSFNFIFQQPGITSAVIGTINAKHLKSNAEAALKAIENEAEKP